MLVDCPRLLEFSDRLSSFASCLASCISRKSYILWMHLSLLDGSPIVNCLAISSLLGTFHFSQLVAFADHHLLDKVVPIEVEIWKVSADLVNGRSTTDGRNFNLGVKIRCLKTGGSLEESSGFMVALLVLSTWFCVSSLPELSSDFSFSV